MPKPRLLLVGYFNTQVYTYASSFARAFARLGYVVQTFNHRAVPWYVPAFGARFFLQWLHEAYVNYKLLQAVRANKPNVLFLLKGDTIWARTLRTIKHELPSCRVVQFYPDNPFVLWNGNATRHVLQSLVWHDLFLIWSRQLVPVLHAAGAPQSAYLPLAYDPDVWYHVQPAQQVDFQDIDVCFVGTWESAREALLVYLHAALPRVRLAIWGNDWQAACDRHPELRHCWRGPALYGHAVCALFSRAKIVLNLIRTQNMDAHNMRTFEVLACKGFLLTQYTHEQAELLFTRGLHLDCFADADELVHQVRHYMQRPEARAVCAAAGYAAVQKFSIEQQLRMALDGATDRSLLYKGGYECEGKARYSNTINP